MCGPTLGRVSTDVQDPFRMLTLPGVPGRRAIHPLRGDRCVLEREASGVQSESLPHPGRGRRGLLVVYSPLGLRVGQPGSRRCGPAASRRCGPVANKRCGPVASKRCGPVASKRCGPRITARTRPESHPSPHRKPERSGRSAVVPRAPALPKLPAILAASQIGCDSAVRPRLRCLPPRSGTEA